MEKDIKEIFTLIKEIKPKEHKLLERAYAFALKAHRGQKRLSGEPYFFHVFETAKILADLGVDTETISAGLLHDVLEDTETTEEELLRKFGKNIVFLVKGVTKLGTIKYRGHQRHVESLRKFFIAMTNDLRVVIIKFADRLHNLRTLKFIREDKANRIAIESIEIYAPLADRLGMGKLKGQLEDAAFPFAYPRKYLEIEEIIKDKKDSYKKNLKEIHEGLVKEFKKQKIKSYEISYRLKHKFSLYRKLLKYDMDIEKIYDIVALRVMVETVEDCYRILGLVHSLWNPLPGRIKDYIAIPKPNGYSSIHTSVFTGSGGIAEIQIRTKEMHTEADYGIAAHFSYKEKRRGKNSRKKSKSKFSWIEELKELNYDPSKPYTFLEHLKTDFFNDRIFIFTPRGDVIDLPENSIPIDFAYSIHSDIGDHTIGAKINGKMSQLFTKLKNGDIVEIIKNDKAHPSYKWLIFVKTAVAKKHIKSYLEKNSLLAKLKSFGRN